jgi:hypothetical protein
MKRRLQSKRFDTHTVRANQFMFSLSLCYLHEMVARVTIVCNRFGNVFMKLARIAYARGASITHYTKPLFIHVLRQTTASIHRSLNAEKN